MTMKGRSKFLLAAAVAILSVGTSSGESCSSETCTESATSAKASETKIRQVTTDEEEAIYVSRCNMWPEGAPLEHTDAACDRAAHSKAWAARILDEQSAAAGDAIAASVLLNLPEEKTWKCPPEEGMESPTTIDLGGGMAGHATKWVVHNRASSPVVLGFVNAMGLEVSAVDFTTYPAHAHNAVYPHGAILLPGHFAALDGRQGHQFVVRQLKETLALDAATVKETLPPTWSFSTGNTRYHNKNIMHVLGNPGRVLMKHRMGNVYVKNQFGALCPEALPGEGAASGALRNNNPDLDPNCNVLRKGFINKVGCPIDLYFLPPEFPSENDSTPFDCERFISHLGPLTAGANMQNLNTVNSPLSYENTYNTHRFIAKMSHDNSLVADMTMNHDIVEDCPEPKKIRDLVTQEVPEPQSIAQPVLRSTIELASNATSEFDGIWEAWTMSVMLPTKVNVTSGKAHHGIYGKYHKGGVAGGVNATIASIAMIS